MENQNPQKIRIAHSPDSDDAFMFYALKAGRVPHAGLDLEFTAADIGVLNEEAFAQTYDITALSFHALAHLQDRYTLLSSGASMAENDYGPLVIAKTPHALTHWRGQKIAIPGRLTTANLLLKMALPEYEAVILPAQNILQAVENGTVAAGLIIHEAQIHYARKPVHVVAKIIDVWRDLAGKRPLPLGCSAVKTSLDPSLKRRLSDLQKQSIAYALAHREEALNQVRQAAPELTLAEADRYLHWYANARTLNLGEEEREAILFLFNTAAAQDLIPQQNGLEIL